MRILVSGSHGLIGSAVAPALRQSGHDVVRLVRSRPLSGGPAVAWDPMAGTIDAAGLEGLDAVVHLAGESIIGRWTDRKKAEIRDSRVMGTRRLAEALARRAKKLAVMLCASATGYYGDRGDEPLREDSSPGSGFLADVCREWEAAADPARQAGIRVAHLRFGMVLGSSGGALAKMLPAFRLGLGGPLGDGTQYVSWIALDEIARIVEYALHAPSLAGPVNAVAPQAVTNREFTKTLARVVRRPALFPVPRVAARLVFGELADALLFASQRVEPARLTSSGYRFEFPELEGALRHAVQ